LTAKDFMICVAHVHVQMDILESYWWFFTDFDCFRSTFTKNDKNAILQKNMWWICFVFYEMC